MTNADTACGMGQNNSGIFRLEALQPSLICLQPTAQVSGGASPSWLGRSSQGLLTLLLALSPAWRLTCSRLSWEGPGGLLRDLANLLG